MCLAGAGCDGILEVSSASTRAASAVAGEIAPGDRSSARVSLFSSLCSASQCTQELFEDMNEIEARSDRGRREMTGISIVHRRLTRKLLIPISHSQGTESHAPITGACTSR